MKPRIWIPRAEAARLSRLAARRLREWEGSLLRTRRRGTVTLVHRGDVEALEQKRKRVVDHLMAQRPIIDLVVDEKLSLQQIKLLRNEAAERGDVFVIEREEARELCEVLDLPPDAPSYMIVNAIDAAIATYRRLLGKPVVRLVEPG